MTTDEKIDALTQQVAELKDLVTALTKTTSREIVWEEDKTSSGIQLQGPTKVKREGTLISVGVLPGNNGLGVVNLVRNDKNELIVLGSPYTFKG
jgi:hypothetical protein